MSLLIFLVFTLCCSFLSLFQLFYFVDRVNPPARWRAGPPNRRGPQPSPRPATQLDRIEAGMGRLTQSVASLNNQQAVLWQAQFDLLGSVATIRRNLGVLSHAVERSFDRVHRRTRQNTRLLSFVRADLARTDLIDPELNAHGHPDYVPDPSDPDFRPDPTAPDQLDDLGELDNPFQIFEQPIRITIMSPNSAVRTYNQAAELAEDTVSAAAFGELSLHP